MTTENLPPLDHRSKRSTSPRRYLSQDPSIAAVWIDSETLLVARIWVLEHDARTTMHFMREVLRPFTPSNSERPLYRTLYDHLADLARHRILSGGCLRIKRWQINDWLQPVILHGVTAVELPTNSNSNRIAVPKDLAELLSFDPITDVLEPLPEFAGARFARVRVPPHHQAKQPAATPQPEYRGAEAALPAMEAVVPVPPPPPSATLLQRATSFAVADDQRAADVLQTQGFTVEAARAQYDVIKPKLWGWAVGWLRVKTNRSRMLMRKASTDDHQLTRRLYQALLRIISSH